MPADIGYGPAGMLGPSVHLLALNVVTRYLGLGPGGIARAERDFTKLSALGKTQASEATRTAMRAYQQQSVIQQRALREAEIAADKQWAAQRKLNKANADLLVAREKAEKRYTRVVEEQNALRDAAAKKAARKQANLAAAGADATPAQKGAATRARNQEVKVAQAADARITEAAKARDAEVTASARRAKDMQIGYVNEREAAVLAEIRAEEAAQRQQLLQQNLNARQIRDDQMRRRTMVARTILTAGVGVGIAAAGVSIMTGREAYQFNQFQQRLRANSQFLSASRKHAQGEFAYMRKFSREWAAQSGEDVESVMTSYRQMTDIGFHYRAARSLVRAADVLALGTGANVATTTMAERGAAYTFGFNANRPGVASKIARQIHAASQLSGYTVEDLVAQAPRFFGYANAIEGRRGFNESLSLYATLSRFMRPQQAGSVETQLFRGLEQGGPAQTRAIENLYYNTRGRVNLFPTLNSRFVHQHGLAPALEAIRSAHLTPQELRAIVPTVRGDLGALLLTANRQGEHGFRQVTGYLNMSARQQVAAGISTPDRAYLAYLKTTAGQMAILRSNLHLLGITIGQDVLPIFNQFLKSLIPIVRNMGAWARTHPALVGGLLRIGLAIGAAAVGIRVALVAWNVLTVAWTAGTWLVSGLATGIGGLSKAFIFLARYAIQGAIVAWRLLSAAFALSPIGFIITALVLLGIGLVVLYNKWKPFHDFVNAAWARLRGFAAWIATALVRAFQAVTNWIGQHWKVLLVGGLLGPLGLIVAGIVIFGPKILSAGKTLAHKFIDGFKRWWDQHNIIRWITDQFKHIPNPFSGWSMPNPFGGGGSSGGPAPKGQSVAGRWFGPFNGASADYASGADVSMLHRLGIPTRGSVMDTDFPSSPRTVRLPGGRSAAYRLASSYMDKNVGGVEVFQTPNGGSVTFLHLGAIAPKSAIGRVYHGGTGVGISGHPLTTAYGNDPNFYHLCVVTDSSGRQYLVWATGSEMKKVAGKTVTQTAIGTGRLPKNIAQYAPQITAAASKTGINPMLLAALITTESSGNRNARTWNKYERTADVGLMQYGAPEARLVGGRVTTDPGQNIMTGAKYLLYLFNGAAHHSWPLAIAMYNAGPGYRGGPNTTYEQTVQGHYYQYIGARGAGGNPTPTSTGTGQVVVPGLPPRGQVPGEPVNRATTGSGSKSQHYENQITTGPNGDVVWHARRDVKTGQIIGWYSVPVNGPRSKHYENQVTTGPHGNVVWHARRDVKTGHITGWYSVAQNPKDHGHYQGQVTSGPNGDVVWHARRDVNTGKIVGWYSTPVPGQERITKTGVMEVYVPAHRVGTIQVPGGYEPIGGQMRTDRQGFLEQYHPAARGKEGYWQIVPGQVKYTPSGQRERYVGGRPGRPAHWQPIYTGPQQRVTYLTSLDTQLNKLYPAHPAGLANMTATQQTAWLRNREQLARNQEIIADARARQLFQQGRINRQQMDTLIRTNHKVELASVQTAKNTLQSAMYGGPARGSYQAYHIFRTEQCAAEAHANTHRSVTAAATSKMAKDAEHMRRHLAEIERQLLHLNNHGLKVEAPKLPGPKPQPTPKSLAHHPVDTGGP